jgi:uncharacterized protein YgiM (DUF1202 family)
MHSIKILVLICFLFSSHQNFAQEFQINGQVSILNSRVENGSLKYAREVIIRTELSPDRITDLNGRFQLNFTKQFPNSRIDLMLEKEGYEVVNKHVLKDIQISENPVIHVFLVKKVELEKKKRELLKFSQILIKERMDSIFKLLNAETKYKDIALESLENCFGKNISDEIEANLFLNQSIKEIKIELPILVHQMATVNYDFATDLYKDAMNLFHEKQLDKAIEILDEKKLDMAFEYVMTNNRKPIKTPKSYQKIFNAQAVQNENIIESFVLKRIFLKMAFRVSEAEILSKKIESMKFLLKESNIFTKSNDDENSVENKTVKVLLEDTFNLTSLDTNWVNPGVDKLVSRGNKMVVSTNFPSAKTILETLPTGTELNSLGDDFENALLSRKKIETYRIPIYEQPFPDVELADKIIETNLSDFLKQIEQSEEWSDYSKRKESKSKEISSLPLQPNVEIKKVAHKKERIVFDDIIEPNYATYKITENTSLRKDSNASSKVLKRLKIGSEVKVIDQVDRYWCKVILDGRIGYVKILLLEKSK